MPAFILFLRPVCATIGCHVFRGDGRHVMADQVTDDTAGLLWCLVMWPDEKDALQGQCWPKRICLAICFVFIILCSSPSLHPRERKGMSKFTPHCPPTQRAFPLKRLAHLSFIHCWASFPLVASFKPIVQHYLRFTVYFAAVGGASSLSHLFYTFFFFRVHFIAIPFPWVWGEFPLYL